MSNNEFTVVSLDEDLTIGVVLLEFGTKTPIFVYKSLWGYRMSGQTAIPDRSVYGFALSAEKWLISRDIRKLIENIDEGLSK